MRNYSESLHPAPKKGRAHKLHEKLTNPLSPYCPVQYPLATWGDLYLNQSEIQFLCHTSHT